MIMILSAFSVFVYCQVINFHFE